MHRLISEETYYVSLLMFTLVVAALLAVAKGACPQIESITPTKIALTNTAFPVDVGLSWIQVTGADAAGPVTIRVEASFDNEPARELSSGEYDIVEEGGAALSKSVRIVNAGTLDVSGKYEVLVQLIPADPLCEAVSQATMLRVIPGGVSCLPPLIVLVLALTTREVLLSLMCGVWGCTFLLHNFNPFLSFLRVWDVYLVNAIIGTTLLLSVYASPNNSSSSCRP
jgi:hypothetical protein